MKTPFWIKVLIGLMILLYPLGIAAAAVQGGTNEAITAAVSLPLALIFVRLVIARGR